MNSQEHPLVASAAEPASAAAASTAEPIAEPAPAVVEVAVVEEEEEPEDPKPAIEAACAETPECKPVKARFDSCTARVSAAESGEEDCVEEFFDLMHCVNNCAPDQIFHHLK